jgi:hypothetical protein
MLRSFAQDGGITLLKGKFRRAAIVLNYNRKRDSLATEKKEITAPVKVLRPLGEEFPGKDVAVLQAFHPRWVPFDAITGRRVLHDSDSDLAPKKLEDMLICLPLGDSDDVLDGASVQALGFPGDAYVEGAMREEAAYRVSCRNGHISQRKPMNKGWEAFEMTADINHGDSGGPVIDNSGRVIALNVALCSENLPGHKLAVPINVAKEFLKKAGITPDPGPLSQHWENGLRLFDQGRWQEARHQFEDVSRYQSPPLLFWSTLGDCEASPYVFEMIGRCDKNLEKLMPWIKDWKSPLRKMGVRPEDNGTDVASPPANQDIVVPGSKGTRTPGNVPGRHWPFDPETSTH